MANFDKSFTSHDDWMTPASAWEDIKKYIPMDKTIWEPFYGDGTSGQILKDLGCKKVIHKNIDFFENDKGQIIISNPPFTLIPQILKRLVELDKPFIMIMPSSKINTQYFRKLFNNENKIQIIIPKKRIQFIKMKDGKILKDSKSQCNFDCFYYCWKMNLPSDIVWL